MRWLAQVHRWLGVVLFLLFAVWFASGAVMHFVPFPALGERQRLSRSALIDLERVRVAPSTALALVPRARDLRLVGVEGRPVYVLELDDGSMETVAGDTGTPLGLLSSQQARGVAAAFSSGVVTDVVGPLPYDQWTVMGELDAFRPLYRARIHDKGETDLYVSARTGEVVQVTTATERHWNWCGAVLHWIYFTALRSHGRAWDRLVWGLSLAGLSTVVAGLWLGWLRFIAARRGGRRKLTPFRGWLGWHHRLGLFLGVFVLTWIFSGWLSMDHGRLFTSGKPDESQIERLQGLRLPEITAAESMSTVRGATPAAELLFGAIAKRTFLAARGAGADRVMWADAPQKVMGRIPTESLIAGVRAAWPRDAIADEGTVTPGSFYSLAEDLPAETRVIRVGGSHATDVYIDEVTGRIVTIMSPGRRVYEWLYYALHTLKFPGLIAHPVLRDLAVLVPMTGGFIFSLTGAIIAVSRLRTSFRRST